MRRAASPAGGDIGWESEGGGPDLVLLHGTFTDRTAWLPLLPYLTDRYRVHSVDRRGRGLSATAAPRPDIGAEVEDLRAVLRSLPDGAAVCGWSHGAVIAAEAAIAGVPMSKLVVYDPPLPAPDSPVPAGLSERFASMIAAGNPAGAVVAFLLEAVAMPRPIVEAFRRSPAWPVALATADSGATEIAVLERYVYDPDRVRACRVPTLVLTGALSPPRIRDGAERLAADLPAGHLRVLEDQHHFAFVFDPAGFASVLTDFLEA